VSVVQRGCCHERNERRDGESREARHCDEAKERACNDCVDKIPSEIQHDAGVGDESEKDEHND